jgi:catalase (peroxidase I)
MAIRLAWHASGTFKKEDGTGGSDGAGMRFEPEATDGANAGLDIMRSILKPVNENFPNLSIADVWTRAGAHACEFAGGPKIPFNYGRTDASDGSKCPANGRLPDASQGAEHLRDVFYRMGFDDRGIVALSGAHTLGRCHKTRSGYDGPWTKDPLKFDNSYFVNLMTLEWTPRQWEGPMQYEDPSKQYMMLPTDLALKTDDAFRPIAQEYADSEAKFFEDFAKYFGQLIAAGCPDHCQPGAAALKTGADTKASADFREHAMHGSIERLKEIEATADIQSADANSNRTALHKAAFWGHGDVVEYLISKGANVNVQDSDGDSPLHDAARFGHKACVTHLLAGGASTDSVNRKGETAAAAAAAYGKAFP